jgi:hypothetical protein
VFLVCPYRLGGLILTGMVRNFCEDWRIDSRRTILGPVCGACSIRRV